MANFVRKISFLGERVVLPTDFGPLPPNFHRSPVFCRLNAKPCCGGHCPAASERNLLNLTPPPPHTFPTSAAGLCRLAFPYEYCSDFIATPLAGQIAVARNK